MPIFRQKINFFQILRPQFSKRMLKDCGMTLIEILVVLAIIGGLMATILPRIGRRQNEMRALFREFTSISKELHSNARLQGRYFRLVFDLSTDPKKPDTYWIESGGNTAKMLTKKQQDDYNDEIKNTSEGKTPPASPDGFTMDTALIKKKRELPPNFKFPMILQQGVKEPFTEGQVAIHYMPQGFVQDTLVQITDKKNTWSLHFNPLTGSVDVIDGAKSFEDIKR